ncbi:MAG: hypothetical protein JHD28_11695, partial [Bacteroidia bacterium]|nr:hypothetical protein [Bacteroidia bacterium]
YDGVKAQIIPPKWGIIPYDFFSHSSHFFEDRDGNIAYKNSETLYLFDAKGELKNTYQINLPNNGSYQYPFRKDGAFFVKILPPKGWSTDYFLQYERNDPFYYPRGIMIDLRKIDSTRKRIGEYFIYDIVPNNIANSITRSSWIFAIKYPDLQSLSSNQNGKTVLIEMFINDVYQEYEITDRRLYEKFNTSSTHFCFYTSQESRTFSYDRWGNFVGSQVGNTLVPNINVLGSFVMKASDGYYLSEDGIKLKFKIPGLPKEAQIFHEQDSLLHIYSSGNYSTINAITGLEVNKFDLKSEKMPISIDTVNTFDYYRTKKGISYLVTSRGIVITN